jgi:teichuronic acid exporter
LNETLKSRTIRALAWSFIESAGVQGVQFVIGIILARLLFPAQFGLIGMLAIFMEVAQSFLDSGFGSALIQKRGATHADNCSVFYFNIVVGLFVAGILCVISPFIAAFYKQPELTSLLRVLSLVIVINSFGLIQYTLITKEINFKASTKVSTIASILSGIVGVTMALWGFGVWSLAAQQISRAIFRTAFFWFFNKWRPSLVFSLKSLRELFGFGSRLLIGGVINHIFDNIYLLVIGKLFSAIDLGFFTRAKSLQEIPSQSLTGMVARVTFPVFSTIQDDKVRLKGGMKKALTSLALINFPLMIGLAITARQVILILFTARWAESIPYLRLLCFIGLLFPVHLINLNVLQAMGRSDLSLRLEIIKKILIVINIVITFRWGITAMIYGMLVLSVISYFLNSYYNGTLINYSIFEQVFDLLPYLTVSLVMGVVVFLIGKLPFTNLWLIIIVQIIIGTGLYIGLSRAFKLPAFMDIWRTVRSKLFHKVG